MTKTKDIRRHLLGWCMALGLLGSFGWGTAWATCLPVAGDLTGDGMTNVADVQCSILVTLATLNGGDIPSCLLGPLEGADTNCDAAVTITDVMLCVQWALEIPLLPLLDEDQDNCVDACASPPDPCAPNPCVNGGVCEAVGENTICTCPAGFGGPTCLGPETSFVIMDSSLVVYGGVEYRALQLHLASSTAISDNWCFEYQNLCAGVGGLPTGGGGAFDFGSYQDCKTTYSSVGVSDSLGCNPSSGVANAAILAGFSEATSSNSFGFHSCGGSCMKEMCEGQNCNSALSYVDTSVAEAYTLCKSIPGGCGIGTDVDVNHCGSCGNVCASTPNASHHCESGECMIKSCDLGALDCDGVYDNGCEIDAMNDPQNCGSCGNVCSGGSADGCAGGTCLSSLSSFTVLESQDIVYADIGYVLLKVSLNSMNSVSENWCQEYQDLCSSYEGFPTGCGDQFNFGSYQDCKTTYSSLGVSNSLGCNPSGGVASAAGQAGYTDATSANSFAFHSCGGACSKQMCAGSNCNSALSYIDMGQSHGYTLCKKIPGECGMGIDVDINNCGTCGNVCAPVPNGEISCNGTCGIAACTNGYSDCDGFYENGCEVAIMEDETHCGSCGTVCAAFAGEACVDGVCESSTSSFTVLESQDVVVSEIEYVLLKVSLNSIMSVANNWCTEYMFLCGEYGAFPTGCGEQFNFGSYQDCKSTYLSDGVSNSLGCNPSGGVASAANQAGYSDATSDNSFGFHSCGGSCVKEMCEGANCNSALSYIDTSQPFGYTLCKKP